MYATLVLVALCSACTGSKQPPAEDEPLTACTDPRPQACTREYLPVCASRDTGVRCVTTPCPSAEWKTYGNACDACADEKVFGHRPGACD
jgi:hypothetical protein